MNRYTVIPKNPGCGTRDIDADGYDWDVARIVFWRADAVVMSCEPAAPDTVIAIVNGVPLLGKGQQLSSLRQTVAEFTVDWVASIVVAKAD